MAEAGFELAIFLPQPPKVLELQACSTEPSNELYLNNTAYKKTGTGMHLSIEHLPNMQTLGSLPKHWKKKKKKQPTCHSLFLPLHIFEDIAFVISNGQLEG